MALPRLGQYQLALQHPATAFDDAELKAATVETTPMGLPRVISGGFALTYHLKHGRKEWAVRCFHREASELGRRYQAIGAMIARAPAGPFVQAEYLAKGVQVEGAWHPITKMPWLAAVPLNRAIETNLGPKALARLAQQFRALVDRLALLGVAHGDLQHGNILVDAFGNLKLVDYDGMFVPALAGLASNESGHINYQHPSRNGQFDASLDRFSAAAIYTALAALAEDPALWPRYSNGENLLFKRADFDDPRGSPLFADLLALPTVRPLAERLQGLCRAEYAALPALKDFIQGNVGGGPVKTRPAPANVIRNQFDVLDAVDVERLLHHEGDVVTVVGKLTAARQRWSRSRKSAQRPYVVLGVGPAAPNALTLELWSEALNFFMPAGQVITAYTGRWVRATGLVSIAHRRDAMRTPRPVIEITEPTDIQLVSEAEALDLLDTRGSVPWYRHNRRTRSTPQRTVSAQAAATLNRLYGAPPADSVPSPAPARKGRTRTPSAKPRVKQSSRTRSKQSPPPTGEWWRHFLPRPAPGGTAASALSLPALGRDIFSRLVKLVLAACATATVTTLLLVRWLW
jgi:hypothetical protein